MRNYFYFILLLTISCRHDSNIDYNNLIGSWTSEFKSDSSVINVQDRLLFKEYGSVIAEATINGELSRIFSGTYKLDSAKRTIVINTDTFQSVSRIESLTSKRLVLRILEPKPGLWRLVKIENKYIPAQ